jgi:hypothetical protein
MDMRMQMYSLHLPRRAYVFLDLGSREAAPLLTSLAATELLAPVQRRRKWRIQDRPLTGGKLKRSRPRLAEVKGKANKIWLLETTPEFSDTKPHIELLRLVCISAEDSVQVTALDTFCHEDPELQPPRSPAPHPAYTESNLSKGVYKDAEVTTGAGSVSCQTFLDLCKQWSSVNLPVSGYPTQVSSRRG